MNLLFVYLCFDWRHLMEELIKYLGEANEHHPTLLTLDDNIG